MADIINLRTWKKQAGRVGDKARADGNAARFGRSKALRKLDQARSDKDRDKLDAHRLDGTVVIDGDDAPGTR